MYIEIEDLQKTYGRGGCPALDDIRLTLENPNMVGLVGPNGTGKTTLMQLLVGQLLPTAGEASGWMATTSSGAGRPSANAWGICRRISGCTRN